MRLVSMVELMAIRERVANSLSPYFDQPVNDRTFAVLQEADVEFRNWYATWDQAFSQKYEDAGKSRAGSLSVRILNSSTAFYRQSLQIQHLHAELFHNATALRGIDGPEDVQKMISGKGPRLSPGECWLNVLRQEPNLLLVSWV